MYSLFLTSSLSFFRLGRYFDASLDLLIQASQLKDLTLLFCDSIESSAKMLVDLARREAIDGGSLQGLSMGFITRNTRKLQFLQSIPGMGIVNAIKLMLTFENLNAIVNMEVDDLVYQGIDRTVATSIHAYLRHSCMLSSSTSPAPSPHTRKGPVVSSVIPSPRLSGPPQPQLLTPQQPKQQMRSPNNAQFQLPNTNTSTDSKSSLGLPTVKSERGSTSNNSNDNIKWTRLRPGLNIISK